jgi:hypothetical protein
MEEMKGIYRGTFPWVVANTESCFASRKLEMKKVRVDWWTAARIFLVFLSIVSFPCFGVVASDDPPNEGQRSSEGDPEAVKDQKASDRTDSSGSSAEARRPRFGGPDAVENQMESDRAEKDKLYELEFLKPYYDWKEGPRLPGQPPSHLLACGRA